MPPTRNPQLHIQKLGHGPLNVLSGTKRRPIAAPISPHKSQTKKPHPSGNLFVSERKSSHQKTYGKPAKSLAHSLAREPQSPAQPGPGDPFDLAAAVPALAALPEADRHAWLDALAYALRGLPLGERATLAATLLDH